MNITKSIPVAASIMAAAVLIQITSGQAALTDRPHAPGMAQPGSRVQWNYEQPAATPGPAGYSPAQIRQAYGFDQLPGTIDGTGQTIAIIDAFGDRYATLNTTTSGRKTITVTNYTDTTQTDWTTFCSQFGLTSSGLTVVYPQGQNGVSTNWALETALDIQWAHAIAPGASILLVISRDNTTSNLLAAVDYAVNAGANVVSMSWGGGEANALMSDYHFNHPNVTFVACSGDGGELSSGTWWPASSPYVLGVGGTSLTNLNGMWSETAWPGSGGGISAYESMPAFQSGWQQFATGKMRSVPDVSYVGARDSCVSVYCGAYGGWIKAYGTSVGAPQWAALVALANSVSGGCPIGNKNQILYSIAMAGTNAPYLSPHYFLDIISGSNGTDPDDFAVAGYDFVTGLGSPKANNLVPALVSVLTTPDFFLAANPSSQSVPVLTPDGTISWTATYITAITRYGGFADPIHFMVSGLPEGATASFNPSPATTSSTLNITVPNSAPPGTYPLTITGSNAANELARPNRTAASSLVVYSGPTSTSVIQPSGASGYSLSGGKNNTANLTVWVLLENNFGQPVTGSTVSITLYLNGSVYGSATGSTLSDGTAAFTTRNAPAGTYMTKVTGVTGSVLTWDGLTPANSYTKTQ